MAEDAINALTHLETLGVSLVTRGANMRRFAIAKQETTMEPKNLEMLSALMKSAGFEGETALLEKLKKSVGEKELAAIQGALRMLHGFSDSVAVKKAATAIVEALVEKAEPAATPPPPAGKGKDKKEPPAATEEEVAAEKKMPGAVKKALEGVPAEQQAVLGPVVKAIYATIKKESDEREAAAQERIEKAERQAKEQEEVVKTERNLRREKEFVSKAEKDFTVIPGKPAELGLLMKDLDDVNPKLRERVETVLKAASALIAKGGVAVLKELGKGGEDTSGDNAWEKIEKSAAAIKTGDEDDEDDEEAPAAA